MISRGERLLLFGGLPNEYLEKWEITSDLNLIEERLHVQFKEIPLEELVKRYNELSDIDQAKAKKLAKQLIEQASQDRQEKPPPEVEVEKATKLYVAMKAFVDEHDAKAVTIVCSPWNSGTDTPVPCVALTLFQEEGIPAACQGDLDAFLAMVLFKRASMRTSFMGGGIKARGHLGVSHCVLSRQMFGTMTPQQRYYLYDYHNRKNSPTIRYATPKGEIVTIARLTRNLEDLILSSGRVLGNQNLRNRCRNTLVIEVNDRRSLLGSVRGIQQHFVVASGDHRKAMTEIAKESGINVLSI